MPQQRDLLASDCNADNDERLSKKVGLSQKENGGVHSEGVKFSMAYKPHISSHACDKVWCMMNSWYSQTILKLVS